MASVNIGETLRRARIKRNISLDELQQLTKIQKRYLIAIEDNDLDALPSQFYARAFIRQYAEEVGEDGDYLVDVLEGKDQPQLVFEEEELEGSRRGKHAADPKKLQLQASLPAMVLGLIAFVILSIVAYYTWLDHKSDPLIATNSSVQVEGSLSSTKASESAKSEAPPSEAQPEEPQKPQQTVTMEHNEDLNAQMKAENVDGDVHLEFIGKESPSWISLTVDNHMLVDHILQPGETYNADLPAGTAEARIQIGYMNQVHLKLNGHDVDFQPNPAINDRKNITMQFNYLQADGQQENSEQQPEAQQNAQPEQVQ